jgi:hypothetical protein
LPDDGAPQPGLLEARQPSSDKHPAGDLVVVRREREADCGNGLPLPSEVVLQPGIHIGVEVVDFSAAKIVRTDVLGPAKQRPAGKLGMSLA